MWRCGWWLHRHFLAQQPRVPFDVPVWIVGSHRIGGGGRTSAVAALAQALCAQGVRCGILTLDWSAQAKPTGWRLAGQGGFTTDEAELLARLCPCVVGLARNRSQALAGFIQSQNLQCVLLDDGFEDPRLDRALRVRIDRPPTSLDENLWPVGRLRSYPRDHRTPDWVLQSDWGRWDLQTHLGPVRTSTQVLLPGPVTLVCGVGDPGAVRRALESLGFEILQACIRPDHDRHFKVFILGLIRTQDWIVMTPKDRARLPLWLQRHPKLAVLEHQQSLSPQAQKLWLELWRGGRRE